MTAAALPARRHLGGPLIAAVTLLALFAMHGLSGGHQVLMPSGSAMKATAHASVHGAHHPVRSAEPRLGQPVTAPAGCAMPGHAECVARLHPDTAQLPLHAPLSIGPAPGEDPAAARAAAAGAIGGRAPPSPDLTALCVCRT